MAKIQFGMYMTDARGKQGGHVFSRNRAGAYVRTKVSPTNPRTTKQTSQRSSFAFMSQGWRGLQQSERDAWNSAVVDFEQTDVFGNVRRKTGKNLYLLINQNLQNSGASLLTVPPLPDQQDGVQNVALVAVAGVAALDVTADMTVGVGGFVHIWVTPQVSQGVSNPNANWYFLKSVAAAPAFAEDILADYVARFGALVAGTKIFVGLTPISATGQSGVRSTAMDIVAP